MVGSVSPEKNQRITDKQPEPLPGSLATVTSPPTMRASLRVIARPSPVRRSACGRGIGLGEFLEQLRLLLRRGRRRHGGVHVVRLLAPRLNNENHTKDIDFNPSGIRQRWEAGYANTMRSLERAAWNDDCDPLEGVISTRSDA
jgi:hypothetical protein